MDDQYGRWLAPDARMAVRGGDAMILSIDQDAYYCLPGAANAIRADVDGHIAFDDEGLAAQLAAAGLTVATPGLGRAAPMRRVQAPSKDLMALRADPTLADGWDMALAYGLALARFRGRPLGRLIAQVSRRSRPGADAPASPALMRRAAAFPRLMAFAPIQGQCLLRAFVLLHFLWRGGEDAHWVFGVRAWPFQAHCWLQAGPCVLDDAAERVASFTPILVV
jgi:hypothetical protein